MTISDFIEYLSEYDPNMPVLIGLIDSIESSEGITDGGYDYMHRSYLHDESVHPSEMEWKAPKNLPKVKCLVIRQNLK